MAPVAVQNPVLGRQTVVVRQEVLLLVSNPMMATHLDRAWSASTRIRPGGAGEVVQSGRMRRTWTPTLSDFHARSAVSTGSLMRCPRARQALSPSDSPAARVDERSSPAIHASA
jgi:hypothetical protein